MMKNDITLKSRKLTLVLLDLIGSTAFIQRAGSMKAAKWLQYHDSLARGLVYKFNGREIDRSDGFLLSFERPIDAVNFALIYQKSIPPRTKLNARIGIHFDFVVEVQQSELLVGIGAKRIELEGLAKNIAARTMSLCEKGQVLLTKEAILAIKNRTNQFTPKNARFVCVGLYRFKGVKEPQQIFAVGDSIQSLQPPKGNEKVKRLGGPKYIRKRARDRQLWDWLVFAYRWLAVISIICWIWLIFQASLRPHSRVLIGLPYRMPEYDAFIEYVIDSYYVVTDQESKRKNEKNK